MRRASVEERRREILEVTVQVVVERGFAATRVADVASKLGVSTGLIHYHFESKEALLAAAFEHAAAEDLARLEAVVNADPPPVAKLDQVFRLYSPQEAEPGWLLWIDGWGEALRNADLARISQELDVRWQEAIEAVIHEGLRAGAFRCADPHAAAWRLAALLDGLGVQVTVHEGALSRPEMLQWVREAAVVELGLEPTAFDDVESGGPGDAVAS